MKTNTAIVCPSCGQGHLIPEVTDYPTRLPDGIKIVVPGVEIEVCDKCGETTISLESSRKVEAYIAGQNEQPTRRELTCIREALDVDQTEMSEILGLGSKTYHRWEKGYQIPSRSMGYYLRVLTEFPEAFAWLRDRGWRNRAKILHVDFNAAFPALALSGSAYTEQNVRFNPAKVLFGRAAR